MQINLYVVNHPYHYELENLCRIFFPNDKINTIYNKTDELVLPYVYTSIDEKGFKVRVCMENFDKTITDSDFYDDNELQIARIVYKLLCDFTEMIPPWGVLTGVRPIKLFRHLANENGYEYAKNYFSNEFSVSEKKVDLSVLTEGFERKIINCSERNSFSLYISIPFCPTRCSYCSFVSQSIANAKRLIQPYLELLYDEIKYTGEISKNLGLKLETVYIGGGTPTTLNSEQLFKLISVIYDSFDMSNCREFTVEAGRPDTITADKLEALIKGGADRISINPQTMNNKILEKIGRKHTAQQTLSAYELARKAGFNHINMDIIAGLPEESLESFKNTLNTLVNLSPESITVHTLSMKKSSDITCDGLKLYRSDAVNCENMVDFSIDMLKSNNYHPYYLYRQSRMVGNLENTGWSKPGKDCLYNVYVMDETHTILACGAGAVTKLKQYNSDFLERVFNFKYPYEYIDRFEEIIDRKGRIKDFYGKYF